MTAYLNSGGGGIQSLVHSPWRLTLALAALIAVAALAVFSLSAPIEAGENPEGQPLFGKCESLKCVDVPVPDGTAERVRGLKAVQISAGSDHAYALTAQGALIGWGFGGNGRLNTPSLDVYRGNDGQAAGTRGLTNQKPVKWAQVAAGNLHTCAVTTEGEVYCWGDNSYGQTDIPAGLLSENRDSGMPNPGFLKIVTGGNHTCVLENEQTSPAAGSIVCWGDDSYGQTGSQDKTFGDANPANDDPLPDDDSAGLGGVAADTNGDLGAPDTVGAPERKYMYVDVTTGTNHTCAVRTSGIVDCWGDNSQGQATVPQQLRTGQPAEIDGDGQLRPSGEFHSIEAGDNFTCAINRVGGALCWGSNSHAQEYPPVGEYTQLSAGRWHACALWTFDDDPQRPTTPYGGNVDCWGHNAGGKAEPPPTVERRTVQGKTVLLSKLSWTQVSAGGTFSCGIFDPVRSTVPDLAANQAIFASATGTVAEGIVECWGIGPAATVPVRHTVASVAKYKLEEQCDFSDDHDQYDVRPTDGWGRIYGLPTDDGAIRFGFKVVQSGPDIWIDPQFRFVPSNGNMTVNRWYYSEPMTVWDAVAPGDGIPMAGQNCDCGSERVVGRIAVRLLESGRMQLALMTPDGRVMANVPSDHDQIPNPAETDKWWATDFIKWYDAP